ncbi:MAG: hypothetical protein KA712_22065 [Myxococcales bacterium]|nr:hypothetical protein [Myxococcales bacterium]
MDERGWSESLQVHREICLGYCHQGPNVMLAVGTNAFGHAPVPGSPGSEIFHEVDLARLTALLAARRGEGQVAPAAEPGTKRGG